MAKIGKISSILRKCWIFLLPLWNCNFHLFCKIFRRFQRLPEGQYPLKIKLLFYRNFNFGGVTFWRYHSRCLRLRIFHCKFFRFYEENFQRKICQIFTLLITFSSFLFVPLSRVLMGEFLMQLFLWADIKNAIHYINKEPISKWCTPWWVKKVSLFE